MKKHREILEEHCKIIEGTVDVMVEEIYKAMDDVATQAFKAGMEFNSQDGVVDIHIISDLPKDLSPKYPTFEDYLKEISDED